MTDDEADRDMLAELEAEYYDDEGMGFMDMLILFASPTLPPNPRSWEMEE